MKPDRSVQCFCLGVVFLLTLLAYGFALQAPLFFDDLPNLTQNPLIQIDGKVFDEWRSAAYSVHAGPLRRPLAMLSFTANHVLFGEFTPFNLKVVNLFLHLLTGAGVYLLGRAIFRSPALCQVAPDQQRLAALFAAAIWLLHPLHVSTVLYSVQRMAQLSTLFVVLGLWLFLRYRLRWAQRGASPGEIIAAALWLIMITGLATLSKENGALLPWLLLVTEVTLFRGVWKGNRLPVLAAMVWVAVLLPLALIACIFLFNPELFTAGYRHREYGLSERVMTQARLLWHYLSWLSWPDIRAMGFSHDDIPLSRGLLEPVTTLYAVLAWLLSLVAAFFLRLRFPLLLFGLLFFLVGHVMESSVLALEMVYEHRNYLPSVGVCLFLGQLLASSRLWSGRVNPLLPVAGAAGIVLLLLIIRSQVWSSDFSMAKTNAANHPGSSRANYFYADALQSRYRQGQREAMDEGEATQLMVTARGYFVRAHELDPGDTGALVSLYLTDEQYFPGLGEKMNWFSVLEDSLRGRVLQASDLAAMEKLVACIDNGGCRDHSERLENLIEELIAQNPREVRLYLVKYNYLEAIGASQDRRVEVLSQARAISPAHASIHYLAIKEGRRASDIATMYEIAGSWLAHDVKRRDLPLIKRLFVLPEAPP